METCYALSGTVWKKSMIRWMKTACIFQVTHRLTVWQWNKDEKEKRKERNIPETKREILRFITSSINNIIYTIDLRSAKKVIEEKERRKLSNNHSN